MDALVDLDFVLDFTLAYGIGCLKVFFGVGFEWKKERKKERKPWCGIYAWYLEFLSSFYTSMLIDLPYIEMGKISI